MICSKGQLREQCAVSSVPRINIRKRTLGFQIRFYHSFLTWLNILRNTETFNNRFTCFISRYAGIEGVQIKYTPGYSTSRATEDLFFEINVEVLLARTVIATRAGHIE